MPSENREYGLAMYAVNPAGEIHFADVRLEAVSEAARQGSTSQASLVAAPRLVPLQPLLNRIPRANPELTLQALRPPPETAGEPMSACRASPETRSPSRPSPWQRRQRPRQPRRAPCGDYTLKAVVRHRETQKTILEAAYPISIVDLPADRPQQASGR